MVNGSRETAVGAGRDKGSGLAGSAADHPILDAGARAGYVASGILHLLIAWLALQVAFGSRRANADAAGAMAVVAKTPLGWVLLVVLVVGFALLAIWQFAEAARGRTPAEKGKAVAKALTYLALAWAAVSFLRGVGESGSNQAKDATAALLELPAGPLLVVAAGVGVLAVGGYHIFKGWTERFRSDLDSTPPRWVVTAGRVGYIAKGVALLAVGGGLVGAGLTQRPAESRGLDGALHDLAELPLGKVLLTLVALGFAAYGFYSFSRSRRART